MVAIFVILRAAFGYLFLVLIVRIVGRRPGKQLTPFEFVLIFYLGGLTLTGMVGPEASITNAITQILSVACCHYALSYARYRFETMARILDGTPLVLLDRDQWRNETLSRMRIQDDDVMNAARQQGCNQLARKCRARLRFGRRPYACGSHLRKAHWRRSRRKRAGINFEAAAKRVRSHRSRFPNQNAASLASSPAMLCIRS